MDIQAEILNLAAKTASYIFAQECRARQTDISEEYLEGARLAYELGYRDCFKDISSGYQILRTQNNRIGPEASVN